MVAVSRFRLRFRRRPAAGGLKPRRDLEAAGPRLRSVRWIQEDNLRSASGLEVLRFAVGMPSECSRQASGRSGTIAHAVAGHPEGGGRSSDPIFLQVRGCGGCRNGGSSASELVVGAPRWAGSHQFHPPGSSRGLAARDCLRHAEAGEDGNGLVALADSVARHGFGSFTAVGVASGGEAVPHAGVNSEFLAIGVRHDRSVDH